MKIKTSLLLCLALAAAVLLGAPLAALAVHPDVTLMSAAGTTITVGTTPYSPKMTCATAACHDYGSGTLISHHEQGLIEGDGQVYWQAYEVTGFAHGISVGRHSNQGRNESYTNSMRSAFGDPFFTSSPGMFGKY